MDHLAIERIRAVLDDAAANAQDAIKKFKNDVWDLPVWVPGHATESGGTRFQFEQDASEQLPRLSMFADEQAARNLSAGGQCMSVPFKYAIYLAHERPYDLDLYFNQQRLSLNHDELLQMRDMVASHNSAETTTHVKTAFESLKARFFSKMRHLSHK